MNKKNENRYRNNQVFFRVTDEEKQIIMERMSELGIKHIGTYMRKMALTGECIIYNFNQVYQQLKEMNYYMSTISKNVNQITKRINSTGNMYTEDMAELRKDIDTALKMLYSFSKAYMNRRDD